MNDTEKVGADFFNETFIDDDQEKEEVEVKKSPIEIAQEQDKNELLDYLDNVTKIRRDKSLKDDGPKFIDPVAGINKGIAERLKYDMEEDRKKLYSGLNEKLDWLLQLRDDLTKAQEEAGKIILGEKVNPDDIKESEEQIIKISKKIKVIRDSLTPEEVMIMQSFKDDKWDNEE